ncbi:MAG: hypothetical protein HYW50_01915 [Candidatus Diapherotrites archaeon]|nr:hypothetical protein [Candidatus Diapherotrites archaeon]
MNSLFLIVLQHFLACFHCIALIISFFIVSKVYAYYHAIENGTHMRQRQIPLANLRHTLYGAGATLVAQK